MNDSTMIQSSEGSVLGEMQYLEPPPPYESIVGSVPTGRERNGPQTVTHSPMSHCNEPVYNGTPPLPPYSTGSNMESEPVVWDDERNPVTDSSSQPIRCTKNRKCCIVIACIAAILIVIVVILVTVYPTKGQTTVNYCTFPYTPVKAKRIDRHSEYHYGISVQYQCMEGHKMIGNSIRTCLYTGEWDHPAPICPAVSCDDPEQISNGHQDMSFNRRERRIYGDVVRYSCHMGYKLSGTRQRFCLSSGKWSGSLPVCTVVSCRRPAAPDNGRVAGTVFTYGQSVSYSCNPGYQLFGNKRRTCTSSGSWNGTTPVCTVRT